MSLEDPKEVKIIEVVAGHELFGREKNAGWQCVIHLAENREQARFVRVAATSMTFASL